MWNNLTAGQRADIIGMAAKQGITNIRDIEEMYNKSLQDNNSYAEGGQMPQQQMSQEEFEKEKLEFEMEQFEKDKKEYFIRQEIDREDGNMHKYALGGNMHGINNNIDSLWVRNTDLDAVEAYDEDMYTQVDNSAGSDEEEGNTYAYGGPIRNWAMIQYHYKHNKTPEEIARIRYKGPYTNKVDWDNTPEGRLINYSENRDSVGYIPSSHRWVAPDKPGYDKNNRGMGVDINTNPYVKKYLKQDSKGNSYLTEADEKLIRYKSIQDAEDSYRRRLEYAQSKIGSTNVPSMKKKAATMSAIYNLGSAKVANTIFENKDAMNALLNGTDDEYINYINNEYKKRGRNERVVLQNNFNDYGNGGLIESEFI